MNTPLIRVYLLVTSLVFTLLLQAQNTSKTLLFAGTYTDNKPGKGIYIYEFNNSTGELQLLATGTDITNPSFLTISHNGKYLYACTDTRLKNNGTISAFAIDSISGAITFINKKPAGGDNPVYVTTDKTDSYVVNATYTGGTASVLKINEDGSLQPYAQLFSFTDGSNVINSHQESSHMHSSVFSPNFTHLYFPDLGSDVIRVAQFNKDSLKPISFYTDSYKTLPGSGPRHLTFHPSGKYAYCTNELNGTITAFKNSMEKLHPIQHIFSYANKHEEYSTADIHVSPDGNFLYASNRGNDENTISIFKINRTTGLLTLVGHQPTLGTIPRNFTISPNGNFILVANQKGNNIVVFKRNKYSGKLTDTGYHYEIPTPSCLKMRTYTLN